MDKLVNVCLEEVGLEGLDGITLETLWVRLRMRDPPFPLRLDDKAKSLLWKYLSRSEDVEFYELPEARAMPKLKEAQLSDGPERHGPSITTVYPIAFIEDKEKGIRGSCTTYHQRKDITNEIRDGEGVIKMSLAEVEERWESKLVIVARQDLRWKCMVGPHGDPEAELNVKQYIMLEAIIRGRSQGEWQCLLATNMRMDSKTVFYHRKNLTKAGFIKRRMAVYQHGDRPTVRTVKLFGHGFNENTTVPMYETLWKGISDILSKKPNRIWGAALLKAALKERYPQLIYSDKIYKNVISGARSVNMVERVTLPHQEVFNEVKLRKSNPQMEIKVLAVRLLKTYDEYTNEDTLEEEEDEDETFSNSADPDDSILVAERNLKSQVLNIISESGETKQYIPHRRIIQCLSTNFYSTRLILRKLLADNLITQIMTDEGRQRTAVYCPINCVERVEKILRAQELGETYVEPGPHAIKNTAGTSGSTSTVKQEFTPESAKANTKLTSNHVRRTQFTLDFMKKNLVLDCVFPILKALRIEEKKMGFKVTCDSKTMRRMVEKLVKEGQLQTLTTFVMSDDGLHTKTITLYMDNELKQSDPAVTSALQVARFRFFGSPSHKRKNPSPPKPKPITVATVDPSGKVSQTNEPAKKKKKHDHKSPEGKKRHKDKIKQRDKDKDKVKDRDKDKEKQKVKERDEDKAIDKGAEIDMDTGQDMDKDKDTEKDMDEDKDTEKDMNTEIDKDSERVKDKERDKVKAKDKDKDIDKENYMDKNQGKRQVATNASIQDKQKQVQKDKSSPQEKDKSGRPYATRKFYYKQLGYQPKMMRMKVCHLFLWYLARGSDDNNVIKTETIHDIENHKIGDDDGDGGTQDGAVAPIPIKIVKADEEKESLVGSLDAVNNNREADVEENIPMDTTENSSSTSHLAMTDIQRSGDEVIQSETTPHRTDQSGARHHITSEGDDRTNQSNTIHNVTLEKSNQSDNGAARTNQSEAMHSVTSEKSNQSDNGAARTNQSEAMHSVTSEKSSQSDNATDKTNQSEATHNVTSEKSNQSDNATDRTNQSSVASSLLNDKSRESSIEQDPDMHVTSIDDDISILVPATEATDCKTLLGNIEFKVYCDTYDWRRYVPPLPYDRHRAPGWCVVRDMLMSVPISVFLNIVSLPIEIKGIKEYLDHPLKRHILMRHLPMHIRKQVLRGRSYLFSIQDLLVKLSSVGLIVLTNMNKVEKDQMTVYICKKASILDTTTSKPHAVLISDQQRYMRRFYELNTMKDVENYWFDLQCICLDTPLGVGKTRVKKGDPPKLIRESRYDTYIRTITQELEDESQPFTDDGIPPGDGRGAGGLDSCFFSHMRRNWNWYNTFTEVTYDRYTAIKSTDTLEEQEIQMGTKSKLKRLGRIQYRRSNMSKGTTVEVVSVNKEQRKKMQATVTNLNKKKAKDATTPPKTKKQMTKEKNAETKNQSKEAKKRDSEISRTRSLVPKYLPSGRKNTITYDDKDEEARSRMNKMRVDWSPEEDSLILLCRVASSILNTKAAKMGAFVPWYVVRDILHKNIERSRDKTTTSVAKRSHHILKNPSTYLNFRICVAEAQADPIIMAERKKKADYSQVSICAKEFEQFVEKLREKFQSSNTTIGALRDIGELNNYVITPVHYKGFLDEETLVERDVKSVTDIHFKLLQTLVLSSLASQRTELFNNMLLYKTYEQYDQDLLGKVFLNLRKLGFCNRNRKLLNVLNAKRIIPVAPITIQLSQIYRDRFASVFHGALVEEIQDFLNSLHNAGNSMVIPTEIRGGDLAGVLGLLAQDKISVDVELPDKIIVVDSNLVELDLGPDSDSDDDVDDEGNPKPLSSRADIQELIKMQEERKKADQQEGTKVQEGTIVDTSSADTPIVDTSSADTPNVVTSSADTPNVDTSSADTPNVDTPIVDTPNVDTSSADTPHVATSSADTPNVDTPIVDTPNVDTSSADTPHVETSSADTPIVDTSSADTPIVDTSSADTPNVVTSSADTPNVDTSSADTPNVDTPNVDTSSADTPHVDTSSADTPNVDTSSADIPQVDTSSVDSPQVNVDNERPKIAQDIVCTTDEPMETEPTITSTSVIIDHSYSTTKQTAIIDTASTDELALDSRASTNKTSNVGETTTPTEKGFAIKATKISHSLWLLLQGHSAKGVMVGKNIQDNTVVYACKVTAYKDAGVLPARTIASEPSSDMHVDRTLLWDFIHQDDGCFVGFRTMENKICEIVGRDVVINAKWSDVDALIQGLNLEWQKSKLEALNMVYNCIDKADTMGICASTDFKQACTTLIPNITAKIILDCVQVLVQGQLILEVGFEMLRFVSTRNASKWLIHSTRLPPQDDTASENASKKQRLDPLVDDSKEEEDKGDETSRDGQDEDKEPDDMIDDDVIVISDDELELLDSPAPNKDNDLSRQLSKTNELELLDSPNKETDLSRQLSKTNVDNQMEEMPDAAGENVEDETVESTDESRKRKRPISPTMCNGTPVTYVGRSWLSIEGYQSTSQLSKYMQYVLMQVTAKPGIKELVLCEFFKDVLHPVECLELLKMLREIGCITRHKAYKLKPTSVFHTEMQDDRDNPFYYYQPTADCLVKIAELNQHKSSSATTAEEDKTSAEEDKTSGEEDKMVEKDKTT